MFTLYTCHNFHRIWIALSNALCTVHRCMNCIAVVCAVHHVLNGPICIQLQLVYQPVIWANFEIMMLGFIWNLAWASFGLIFLCAFLQILHVVQIMMSKLNTNFKLLPTDYVNIPSCFMPSEKMSMSWDGLVICNWRKICAHNTGNW